MMYQKGAPIGSLGGDHFIGQKDLSDKWIRELEDIAVKSVPESEPIEFEYELDYSETRELFVQALEKVARKAFEAGYGSAEITLFEAEKQFFGTETKNK